MRFVVKERRMYDVTYVIDAEDEIAAKSLRGIIIEEDGDVFNSFAYELIDVEQVDDDFYL